MFWRRLRTGLPLRLRLALLPGCWLLACLAVGPPVAIQAGESASEESWAELSADKDRLAREFAHFVKAGKLDEAVAAAEKWLAAARLLLAAKPGGADGEKALQQARREIGTLLEWLALEQSRRGDWPAALRRQRELAELWEQVHGKADYRAADARREVEYLQRLQGFAPDDARQLATADRLDTQAWEIETRGKPRDALSLAEEALKIRSRLLGENDARTALSLTLSGRLQDDLGNYAAAEPLYRRAVAISRKVLGENHPDFAQSLSNLGTVYSAQGAYARAEPLYREALEIVKRVLGEDHPAYAAGLNNLALLYKVQGAYAQAEPLYHQVLEIYRRVYGENHPAYAVALCNLANLLMAREDYAQAEPLLQQAIAVRKKVLPENHPDCAVTLNDLASLYDAQADYALAEPLYQQALTIRRKALGDGHPDVVSTLNNLAGLYLARGDYARAVPLLQQAEDSTKKTFGENHFRYALSLNNLAFLYRSRGDYARAMPLCRQALEIEQKALGDSHPAYAATLNNLANIYQALGDYAQAEKLLRQSLQIKRRDLGADRPGYALGLNNLAALYYDQGDYARAEPLYRQALEIHRRVFGENHPDYARNLNNLAAVYFAQGDWLRAEPLYEKAAEIRKRAFGESHPSYAVSLNNLGALYYARGDFLRAEPLLRQSLDIMRAQLAAAAIAQSQRQQLAMLEDVRFYLDSYLTLAVHGDRFAEGAYREALAWKGIVLRRQRLARAAAESPELRKTFDRLRQVAAQLTLEAWATPDPAKEAGWRTLVAKLSGQKERLEADLSAACADFVKANRQVTLEELQSALPPDVALVDFLEYDHVLPPDPKAGRKQTWERRLLAFVVAPGQAVKMVPLGPAQPVREAIKIWRRTFGMSPDGAAAGRLLRQRLWEPLQGKLQYARTLLVSPDGPLCQLPVGALPGKRPETYLLEERAIAVVPVPQLIPEIVRGRDRKRPPQNLLLLGNVDYDAQPAKGEPSAKTGARGPGRTLSEDLIHFDPLSGAQAEIAAIERLYRRQIGAQGITVLEQAQAGKQAFLAEARRHRCLHAATHGFFIEDNLPSLVASGPLEKGRFGEMLLRPELAGLYPGLLSGLALAGANWSDKAGTFLDPNADDGILTAEEIGAQNFDGMELVVLSACETGLGKAAGGEGLLSLQRAFQSAGARTVVASLWSVPDEETRSLMEAFYENQWQKQMGVLKALREAQLWVLSGGPSRSVARGDAQATLLPKRLSPQYWAAFVLSGDWR
jgi:CHAT domain-containing protein/tetratricopeptide (TPR) repeat protein